MSVTDYDRWKCREFVHQTLQVIAEDQLPIFWYYLAFGCEAVLRLDGEPSVELQRLCDIWAQMSACEHEDVLQHFVLIMTQVAKAAAARVASLPSKEEGNTDE